MEVLMCNALDMAKYFINKAHKNGEQISNKKLQKLLYYSQAWNLVIKDEPLFNNKIEAWIHGPAIKSVYSAYRKFGFKDIDIVVDERELKLKKEEKEILDAVFVVYGKYDANYLEILSHNEKPWQKAREGMNSGDATDKAISLSDMKEYYTSLKNN